MTLQEIFDWVALNPWYFIAYLVLVPVIAFAVNAANGDSSVKSPYGFLYTGLIYLSSIPGVFALTLCIYKFLFENGGFLSVNILVYFMPILSMLVTLSVIRQKVDLNLVPGFEKISGYLMMMFGLMAFMFFLDRTHIFAFVRLPFMGLVAIFIIALVGFQIGWSRIFAKPERERSEW